jgi:amino acid permease
MCAVNRRHVLFCIFSFLAGVLICALFALVIYLLGNWYGEPGTW